MYQAAEQLEDMSLGESADLCEWRAETGGNELEMGVVMRICVRVCDYCIV